MSAQSLWISSIVEELTYMCATFLCKLDVPDVLFMTSAATHCFLPCRTCLFIMQQTTFSGQDGHKSLTVRRLWRNVISLWCSIIMFLKKEPVLYGRYKKYENMFWILKQIENDNIVCQWMAYDLWDIHLQEDFHIQDVMIYLLKHEL